MFSLGPSKIHLAARRVEEEVSGKIYSWRWWKARKVEQKLGSIKERGGCNKKTNETRQGAMGHVSVMRFPEIRFPLQCKIFLSEGW